MKIWQHFILLSALFTGALFLNFATRVATAQTFLVSGSLIKLTCPVEVKNNHSCTAVYYHGQDGKRYVFPNAKTYFTWYGDFSTVKTVSAETLASLPIGGNVTYRPGVKLVKITTDPKVYAVAAGGVLRWVKTEEVARALYGLDWNKKVDDIPDAFFVNYTVGADIATVSDFSPSAQIASAKEINTDTKLLPVKSGLPTLKTSKLVHVKNWLYLIGTDLSEDLIRKMVASSYDLIVIQYIPSEKSLENYPMAEVVRRLHTAPKPKLVIAYIDIGQAETARTYWKNSWRVGHPDWIVSDDPDGWPGAYPVGYWRKAWRDIWMGNSGYMHGIVGSGFDGIYLDWVEAYDYAPVKTLARRDGVDAEKEMVNFVRDLAQFGRSRKAEFLVISQNASELPVRNKDYFSLIDAEAQEQVWFDGAATGLPEGDCPLPQLKAEVDTSAYYKSLSSECLALYDKYPDSTLHMSSEEYLGWLQELRARGMPVFTVDYAIQQKNVDFVRNTSRELGFVPFVGKRDLGAYVEPMP